MLCHRLEDRAREESASTLEIVARAGVSGFAKYLNKVDSKITSITHPKGKGPESGEGGGEGGGDATSKWRHSRCGGRGACQLFGPWDGKRPHGVGKAKFLMVRKRRHDLPLGGCVFAA